MNKVDAIESKMQISASKSSKKKSPRYTRKDPSHGMGYFFYRSRKNKEGITIYYWYQTIYNGGKRDKEYLGSNTNPKCPPKNKEEHFEIQEARAYKNGGKPKHST